MTIASYLPIATPAPPRQLAVKSTARRGAVTPESAPVPGLLNRRARATLCGPLTAAPDTRSAAKSHRNRDQPPIDVTVAVDLPLWGIASSHELAAGSAESLPEPRIADELDRSPLELGLVTEEKAR